MKRRQEVKQRDKTVNQDEQKDKNVKQDKYRQKRQLKLRNIEIIQSTGSYRDGKQRDVRERTNTVFEDMVKEEKYRVS